MTTFAKDCCGREMLIEAVERRFGAIEATPADQEMEFLSDNGGAYIAPENRSAARQFGLQPINTFKRD